MTDDWARAFMVVGVAWALVFLAWLGTKGPKR